MFKIKILMKKFFFQKAAEAEEHDNIAEQTRLHGKAVSYGDVIQVK